MSETKHIEWNSGIEKALLNIQLSCKSYKEQNLHLSNKLWKRYNILMYMLIIFSPISGILSAVSSEEYNRYLQIVIIIISFFTGVLSTIVKFSKLEEKTVFGKTVSNKYASLENNIMRQLSLEVKDRINAGKYIEWIFTQYDELFKSSTVIPNSLVTIETKEEKENKKLEEEKEKEDEKEDEKGKEKGGEIVINVKSVEKVEQCNEYSDGKMKYELSRLYRI